MDMNLSKQIEVYFGKMEWNIKNVHTISIEHLQMNQIPVLKSLIEVKMPLKIK